MNTKKNDLAKKPIAANDLAEMNYNDLTHKIIGCAMQVHGVLRNGFQEVIYQRALGIEFTLQNIAYARESDKRIFYKEVAVGTRMVDFCGNLK